MQNGHCSDNVAAESSAGGADNPADGKIPESIRNVLKGEKFGALATTAGNQPHSTLVAVAPTPDLKRVLLATPRSTRKFSNLQDNPRVSLLIDSVAQENVDFEQACAVTAVGTAREITHQQRERFLELYLGRHPALRDFVRSPSCALIEIDVDVYYLARHFQEVMEWHLKS